MNTEPHAILETLISASNRLIRTAAQHTAHSMTSATARTLSILSSDGPLRTDELAAASRTGQPGMTKLLRNMVADELVYRIAEVDDARAWLIAITPKGTDAMLAWRRDLADAMAPLFDDLADDDWKAIETTAALLDEKSRREVVFA
ncbi:hypothetical protein AX769_09720 [Frondihabitans sp. PAMC 28766]|uniref:MarR family winged helix-turn-helix transcriptional regulator n=1 Tax=Frondihabitans sp. PAMC 28766 TaxID=1795630 RepID=UPI00078BB379|nr:MarR family winged helix-turn-helix transcriptional regulator [Frondihabitans sp. PAMC 28766]AMM20377.1 hypothetical protein AX769_09720 [Frondihabitans sp. PAMC 28766]